MFAGLQDVEWAALEHAYGSAEDVPSLLQDLASDDAAERETALAELYRAVHHQGNVYDSTIACVPFLFELAANAGVAERGQIIDLIASIGAAADGGLGQERAEEIISWMTDDDAVVRRAASLAVADCVADTERVIGLFQARAEVEADFACLSTFFRAAAEVVSRGPWSGVQPVVRWLEEIVGGDGDPGTRLAAFVELARLVPDRPADGVVVEQAVELLREATEIPTGEFLSRLNHALGDHVPGRIILIEDQLRHPDPDRRVDALRLAGELIRGWRGSYASLVALIGGQLAAPEPQVRRMALLALKNKYDLAAPAAEALAEQVAALGPDTWDSPDVRVRKDFREMVIVLARLGDERVLPILDVALTQDIGVRVLASALAKYRSHADRFVPMLRTQLRAHIDEMGSEPPIVVFGLLTALRELGAVDAVPDILQLLDRAVEGGQRLVREVAEKALASLGHAGAKEDEQTDTLPSALAELEAVWAEEPHSRIRIAEYVRDLGAAAEPLHPLLRAELATPYRHAYSPGITDSEEVRLDEQLLHLCRQTLEGAAEPCGAP